MGEINPRRDGFEIALARRTMERDLPLLGICRGCQVINAAAGGSLIQDIDGELSHVQKAPRDYPFHAIFIEPESKLLKIVGRDEVRVNSFHHQGIDQPGRDLLISAFAADGTAEAIESTAYSYVLGLQWHPECLRDEVSRRVFRSFLRAAEGVRANKTGR
jgi:putative glutamine amidotransferase